MDPQEESSDPHPNRGWDPCRAQPDEQAADSLGEVRCRGTKRECADGSKKASPKRSTSYIAQWRIRAIAAGSESELLG